MSKVSFGVFDWIDRGTQPLSQLYEDRLQLLAAADEAGFFCYHLAEHHATLLGMAPSRALFLTAATQRTRRIRLGPLVYLLPLYDPLRLIEEVAMLDQLSGGRLELGVGRGVSPYELRNFGVDPKNSRAMFDEALAVLLAGLTQEQLSFAGAHYHYRDARSNCIRCNSLIRHCGTRLTRLPAQHGPFGSASPFSRHRDGPDTQRWLGAPR